jgi:SAM-dependent methyltransferase
MTEGAGADAGQAYDRAYFDHWYRGEGFGSKAVLRRKVGFAVAAAEYVLARPIQSVLDVGCGEGPWQPVLAELRPRARYVGVDPSAYAVERFGTRRHLRLGTFAGLERAVPPDEGTFDLIVCVDVLGYVDDATCPRAGRQHRAGPGVHRVRARSAQVRRLDRGHRAPGGAVPPLVLPGRTGPARTELVLRPVVAGRARHVRSTARAVTAMPLLELLHG